MRTPRDAFQELGQFNNLRDQGFSHSLPSISSSNRYGNEDNDSEVNSEESFESELSPNEKSIHRSAILSCYGNMLDESTSSDDEKSESDSEPKSVKPSANEFDDSVEKLKQRESFNLKLGESSTSARISHRGDRLNVPCRNLGLSKFRRVSRVYWPYWVYQMYDSYYLAQRAAGSFSILIFC